MPKAFQNGQKVRNLDTGSTGTVVSDIPQGVHYGTLRREMLNVEEDGNEFIWWDSSRVALVDQTDSPALIEPARA